MQATNNLNSGPGTTAGAHIKQEGGALKSKTEAARDQAKQKAQHAYDELRQGTRKIARDSGSYIKDIAVEQQHCLVVKLEGYCDALKATSDQLESDDNTTAAKNIRKATGGLECVTDYLRESEPQDLLSDAGDMARKHPELVFGGLFLVGLGMARVMKSSARERRKEEYASNGGPPAGERGMKPMPPAAEKNGNPPIFPPPVVTPATPPASTVGVTSTPTHHE